MGIRKKLHIEDVVKGVASIFMPGTMQTSTRISGNVITISVDEFDPAQSRALVELYVAANASRMKNANVCWGVITDSTMDILVLNDKEYEDFLKEHYAGARKDSKPNEDVRSIKFGCSADAV